jgi:hypothetical protein
VTILLAPVTREPGTKLSGNIYRKQVLKDGQLDYKGRKLSFNGEYYDKIVQAFKAGAYDSVPFMLAGKDNEHTMAPERAHGEVLGFEPAGDGLDMILRLSSDAAKIVEDNPKFGVSARIVEGLTRGDGFTAPVAIQHVLGTWDPRMTGMSPWRAVEMSNTDGHEVIDLTEGGAMPDLDEKQKARLGRLLDLPDADFEKLITAKPGEGEDDLTDEEAERLLREAGLFGEDDKDVDEDKDPAEKDKVTVGLSSEAELRLSQLEENNRSMASQLATERWKNERNGLATKGVPPRMLDLAAPVLSSTAAVTIDLANGSKIDPADVIRKILAEAKGTVDLSEELGHSGDDSSDETDKAELRKAADASGLLI